MEKATQHVVRERAGGCCEYCRFPESFAELPFHLDHVIARQHGGPTTATLFNPRWDEWRKHFVWQDAQLNGLTATGRATIKLLQINRADAVAVRRLLMHAGAFTSE